ncbi:Senescence-associated protein [Asimina triloba]
MTSALPVESVASSASARTDRCDRDQIEKKREKSRISHPSSHELSSIVRESDEAAEANEAADDGACGGDHLRWICRVEKSGKANCVERQRLKPLAEATKAEKSKGSLAPQRQMKLQIMGPKPFAEATKESLDAAGHALGIVWAASKIRKAINPKSAIKPSSLAKSVMKAASSDMNSKQGLSWRVYREKKKNSVLESECDISTYAFITHLSHPSLRQRRLGESLMG